MKKILITGANGQDGTNIIKYLIENIIKDNNFTIFASVRDMDNLNEILIKYNDIINIVKINICNKENIEHAFKSIMPDYFINLAGQSSVGRSWKEIMNTFNTNTNSIINMLDIIKLYNPKCRFFNAGSSEEFGKVKYSPQDINHPKNPKSPYAISKTSAHNIIKMYRNNYNIFAVHSIMYNHEGIYRGKNFVTRKITSTIARIKQDLDNNIMPEPLELGNINSYRDFGDSEEYVEAIWLMINHKEAKDYIVSSNKSHSLIEFVDKVFQHAKIPVIWNVDTNDPINTKVYHSTKKYTLMRINKDFYRPNEVENLIGDYSEIKTDLGWYPKTSFDELVKKMIDNDIKLISN